MKRPSNLYLWSGFGVALLALLSYIPIFVRFPVTRDFPWVNLVLFVVAGFFLYAGVKRAFRQPDLYRGKVSGSILGVLSILMLGYFLYGIFYYSRQLPASTGAPRVGQKAPDFTLPDSNGTPVTLSALLTSPALANGSKNATRASGKTTGVLLIFYRGYW